MATKISRKVRAKLANKSPPVTECEIDQCFMNITGCYVEDIREQHKSDPPTLWFVAETDMGRKLKVAFIPKDGDIIIRSAFDANETEKWLYSKLCNKQ